MEIHQPLYGFGIPENGLIDFSKSIFGMPCGHKKNLTWAHSSFGQSAKNGLPFLKDMSLPVCRVFLQQALEASEAWRAIVQLIVEEIPFENWAYLLGDADSTDVRIIRQFIREPKCAN